MMKKFLPYIILLMALMAGCRLDPPVYPDILDILPDDISTFLPTNNKANWEYDVTRATEKTVENHFLSGEVIAVDGKDYYTVTITPSTVEEIRYFSKAGGLYTMRTIAPTNGEAIELEYLKDDAQVGDSWMAELNAEGMFDGYPASTETKVRETDLTRVIAGRRYFNITHTMIEIQHDTGDGMRTFAVYHFYVAKGIGVIEMTADFENETLTTYLLKTFRLK